MVVAIDGPSGVGKTTVARAVAAALGIAHLDTGSYYRVATLACLEAGSSAGDPAGILSALQDRSIDFSADDRVLLDGVDVSERLRAPDVTTAVSEVSAHPEVRAGLVALQRAWVRSHSGNAVVIGRDIGTVVFPDAAVKVFLIADVSVRARRRAGDIDAEGVDIDELSDQIARRDYLDSSRAISPLRAADDAVIIDTSEISAPDVVRRILDLVGKV